MSAKVTPSPALISGANDINTHSIPSPGQSKYPTSEQESRQSATIAKLPRPISRPATASSATERSSGVFNSVGQSYDSERPHSRSSIPAPLSTPASTTSSIFPSNHTASTTKSSGMSSPASASDKCFTPATSTATTSPSSAPYALGSNLGPDPAVQSQQKQPHPDSVKVAEESGKIESSEPETASAVPNPSQQDYFQYGGSRELQGKTAPFVPSSSWKRSAPSSTVGVIGPPSSRSDGSHSARPAAVSNAWTDPNATNVSDSYLRHFAASAWTSAPGIDSVNAHAWLRDGEKDGQGHGSTSGLPGNIFTSHDSHSLQQHQWIGSSDKTAGSGDGTLGLQNMSAGPKYSTHAAVSTGPPSPSRKLPNSTTTPTENQEQLRNLQLALQAFEAAGPAGFNQGSRGLGFDHVFAPGRGLGRGIGNGLRSDGVWSASVSPSMTIQALPMTATTSFGGQTPIAARRGPLSSEAKDQLSLPARNGDDSNVTRPRSATTAPSTAAAAALGGAALTPAEIDHAIASASLLKGLAAAQSGRASAGSVTPDGRVPESNGHSSPDALELLQQQQNHDNVAAATAAAIAALGFSRANADDGMGGALGLTTSAAAAAAAANSPSLPHASAASGMGRPHTRFPHGLEGNGQGTPSLSAPASTFGSPATFTVPLMHGDQMMYQHMNGGGPSPNNRKLNLYKTELCRNWEEKGTCRYGVKCQYAHGEAELRPVQRHAKYKTEICRTFWRTGSCPYAKRCCFIHTTAADAGADFVLSGHGAPLISRVNSDRHSQDSGSGSAHSSLPNSPTVAMNRPLTGGMKPLTNLSNGMGYGGSAINNPTGGAEHSAGKPDPLALSSLNDALAGINLQAPAITNGFSGAGQHESRFRHQNSASVSAGAGHGHSNHVTMGSTGVGHGPRFFRSIQ
ncbi:hypothetical protein OC861_003429 [Tilletia horrida]|nr:hypothetical protein OC861_003429 [Tilletia horrida]